MLPKDQTEVIWLLKLHLKMKQCAVGIFEEYGGMKNSREGLGLSHTLSLHVPCARAQFPIAELSFVFRALILQPPALQCRTTTSAPA